MQQITEQTTGTFDVVNRQNGLVVGTIEIVNGEYVTFTPAELPAVMQSSEQPTEQAAPVVDDKAIPDDLRACDNCGAVWHESKMNSGLVAGWWLCPGCA